MNKNYSYDLDEHTPAPTPDEIKQARGNRIMLVLLALLAIMAISLALGIANAQTAPARTAEVTFARPAKYTDGTTLPTTVAVTYNLYQGARGSTTKPKVGTISTTGTTISSGLLPGETCWQVSTVANGIESALSNEACKTFPWPATEVITITVK